MKTIKSIRGFTLVEIGVGLLLLAIVLIGALNFLSDQKRASTPWVQGKFKLAPTTVKWAPATPSFVFEVRNGVGVDKAGQPATLGKPLANRNLSFNLMGSGGDPGVILKLNNSDVNATSGSEPTDVAGIVIIQVQLDDDGPYILDVKDVATGASERHFFVAEE